MASKNGPVIGGACPVCGPGHMVTQIDTTYDEWRCDGRGLLGGYKIHSGLELPVAPAPAVAALKIGDRCPVCVDEEVVMIDPDQDMCGCTRLVYHSGSAIRRNHYEPFKIPAEPVKKRVIPEYPHHCIRCGAPAYIGLNETSHQDRWRDSSCR